MPWIQNGTGRSLNDYVSCRIMKKQRIMRCERINRFFESRKSLTTYFNKSKSLGTKTAKTVKKCNGFYVVFHGVCENTDTKKIVEEMRKKNTSNRTNTIRGTKNSSIYTQPATGDVASDLTHRRSSKRKKE